MSIHHMIYLNLKKKDIASRERNGANGGIEHVFQLHLIKRHFNVYDKNAFYKLHL